MNHKVIKNIPKKNMVIMEKSSPYKKQIGGNHYSKFKVQPSKFINDNKLLFAEGNAIKYICRHSYKKGKEDLKKAIHYIEMIIERDYS
tara:strand:- start:158 stop:421 length:264 start_codon:yes stop_codon:yes gene_type:complete